MAERARCDQRMAALHKTAAALHRVGALDEATMRDLDAFCLTPLQPVRRGDIRQPREGEE
jgi:putative transcriptional regulator